MIENFKEKIESAANLYKSGNLTKCEVATKDLINLNPNVSFLHNLLGMVYSAQNRIDESIESYKKGIKIDPNNAIIYNNLGIIYYNKIKKGDNFDENIEKAEELYKKAIKLNSKIPQSYSNLGNLYNLISKDDKAIKYHKLSIDINPKYYFSYLNIANSYIAIGNFKEAKKNLDLAININPNFTFAHRLLSRITKYKKGDKHLLQLKKIYKQIESHNNIDKMNLAFALGKANEDVRNFKESFSYFQTANSINKSKINFNLQKEKDNFNEIKKTFNESLFNKYKKKGIENFSPIFIVGMPRSGTTLIEQIIASHSQVFGADETEFIPSLINKYFEKKNINLFLQGVFEFNTNNLNKIAEEYLSRMKSISNDSIRTTDKLPENFLNIGLIKLIFPKAKIVHCHRNPKDNIFSIYKNHFPGNKITYVNDLNDAVEYYNLYYDLMKFWNSLLPNYILNIKYENLVKNTKLEVEKLLTYCNLKWENSCLEFYKNKRPIKTASDVQVRSKIYNSSIDFWKNYEKFLNKYYDKLKI